MTAEDKRTAFADEQDRVDAIVTSIVKCESLWRLNRVHAAWEDRMKALAAESLKPGSDEPIDDVSALDYIWDLGGDRSYVGGQAEPFRPNALDYYVGRKVRHVWGTGTLVRLKSDGYGIRVRLSCARCRTGRVTVYARPGCHNGAFCYVYDAAGKYLADLRNQECVCAKCVGGRRKKQVTPSPKKAP